MNNKATKIKVEVAYALPEEQTLLLLEVDDAITVEEVIEQSGILQQYPEIDLTINKIGIFSKIVKLNQTVRGKRSNRNIPTTNRRPERGT